MMAPNDISLWWPGGRVSPYRLVEFDSRTSSNYSSAESASDGYQFCSSLLVSSWSSCQIPTLFHEPFVLVRFDNTRHMIYIE